MSKLGPVGHSGHVQTPPTSLAARGPSSRTTQSTNHENLSDYPLNWEDFEGPARLSEPLVCHCLWHSPLTTAPMHHSLNILEILENILVHLDSEDRDRRWCSRPDLAALARTCRIFKEPALDALWRSQYTLNNILRTLPSDAWNEPEPLLGPIVSLLLQRRRQSLKLYST